MKKKAIVLLIMGYCALEIMGCGNAASHNSNGAVTEIQADVLEDDEETSVADSEGEILVSEEILKIPDFSGELDFTFDIKTDAQPENETRSNFVYTENGYYRFGFDWTEGSYVIGKRLYYYDNALGEEILVCDKINCTHTSEECNACFINATYPTADIWQYEGDLYLLKQEGELLEIEKVSQDGATREKSCTLMRQAMETTVAEDGSESTSYFFPELQLHKGYVYWSDYYPGSDKCTLYSVKLNSSEDAEVLYTISENSPCLYRLKPYGRYLLFQMGNFDSSYENFSGGIYAYDTQEKSVSRLCEEGIRDYCVWKDLIYYFDLEDNVKVKNLQTGETSLFYKNERDTSMNSTRLFSQDTNLIYEIINLDNEEVTQLILDENGNVTSVLEQSEAADMLHPYMF